MTQNLHYNDFRIELYDDYAYVSNSPDSSVQYDIVYDDESKYVPNSKHAIKIYQGDEVYKTAILLGSSGGTGMNSDAALIDDDNLIIRCSNQLFSLTLPDLKLNWRIEPDWATCFEVHQYKDSYIIHGEMAISRVDRNGNILWSYSGADIFVRPYEGAAFEMHNDYILLRDFKGGQYTVDYDGKTIGYREAEYDKQEPVTYILRSKKPWWKFW